MRAARLTVERRRRAARSGRPAARPREPAWMRRRTIVSRAARASSPRPSASTRRGPGVDLCDPASPLRLERDPAEPLDAVASGPVRRARIGVAYAGEDWAARPWRFAVAGHRSVSAGSAGGPPCPRPPTRGGRPADGPPVPGRSSSSRWSASGSRRPPRSRPSADWPRRSSRPRTRSSSRAGSTRPTRRASLLEERPGVGIGAAHDIGPAIERAARGGRLEPGAVPRDRRDARCDRAPRHVARRRAAAAAARRSRASYTPCPRSGARSRAASIRSASCSTRRRRGSAGCAPRSASRTTGCAGAWMRSSARSSGTPSRSRSSRSATAATSCRSRPRRARG